MPTTAASPHAAMSASPRLLVLDVLRGVSLLGIAVLNAPAVLHLSATAGADSRLLYFWTELLFRGHFFPVFSLLFGVSFALIMANTQRRGQAPVPTFLRRLALLAVFGLIHHQFQPGEALLPYAIFGLLLLPFWFAPRWLIFLASAVMTLFALWTSSLLLVPPLFLLGLGLQRLRVFEQGERLKPLLWKLWPLLTALAVGLIIWHAEVFYEHRPILEVAGFGLEVGALAGLAGAGAWMTGLWLLTLSRPDLALWSPLARLGRMSLTNYVLQTVVFSVLALLGWFRGGYSLVVPACLLAYAVNLALSYAWLARHRRGPLEQLWHWGTHALRPTAARKPQSDGAG